MRILICLLLIISEIWATQQSQPPVNLYATITKFLGGYPNLNRELLTEKVITDGLINLNKVLKVTLTSSSPEVLNDSQKYFDKIRSIAWTLYGIAIAKDSPFISGAMIVDDPDGRLFKFFQDYVKNTKQSKLRLVQNVPAIGKIYQITPTLRKAYERLSSHLKQFATDHYGIDILGKGTLGFPPGEKKHMLFFQIPKQGKEESRLFIKFETNGLGFSSGYFGHTIAWARYASGIRKDKGKHERNEFASKEILDQYQAFKDLTFGKDEKKTLEELSKNPKTVGKLMELLRKAETSYCQKFQELDAIKKNLKNLFPGEDDKALERRFGNEVTVTTKDIQKFGKAAQ